MVQAGSILPIDLLTPVPYNRISETVQEKKYQSRAFLLLPMTFNIGTIIGPILGGLLSDPAGSYPHLFGHVEFFKHYPYAAPNILWACFLLCAMLNVSLVLEEVSRTTQLRPNDDSLNF